MNQLTIKLILACLFFTTGSLPLLADLQSDVFSCLSKNDNDDRLDCYDTVVKYYKTRPQTVATTTPSEPMRSAQPAVANSNQPAASNPSASSLPTTALTTAPTTPTPPFVATAPVSAEDAFGQPNKKDELESLQSRLVGEFSGWKKGMKLKLENGQVWKVVSRNAGYKKLSNPIITIKQGIFGTYNASVKGLNAGAKVKRIK